MILVSSEGPSAVIWASLFGLYQEAGTHGGGPCFAQLHDTSPAPPSWLYRAQDTGCWVVGPQLGAVDCALANTTVMPGDKVPSTGWLYSGDRDWCEDQDINIKSMDKKHECGMISVRKGFRHLGLFTPTAHYSAGRRVFRSRAGRYLLVTQDSDRWMVTEDKSGHGVVLSLALASHFCPAYTKAKTNEIALYCSIHTNSSYSRLVKGNSIL